MPQERFGFIFRNRLAGYLISFVKFATNTALQEIRQRYVRSILRQDIGWHDKAEDGSLTTRLSLDTQMIQDGIGTHFKLGLSN